MHLALFTLINYFFYRSAEQSTLDGFVQPVITTQWKKEELHELILKFIAETDQVHLSLFLFTNSFLMLDRH